MYVFLLMKLEEPDKHVHTCFDLILILLHLCTLPFPFAFTNFTPFAVFALNVRLIMYDVCTMDMLHTYEVRSSQKYAINAGSTIHHQRLSFSAASDQRANHSGPT